MLFGCEAFEFQIMTAMHNWLQSDFMDFVMRFISEIGNEGAVWIVTALILISKRKYRVLGLELAFGLLLGLILGNFVLKNVIARPRPCWIFENINMLIDVPRDYSFPSGHTLSSFTSAFILLSEDKRMGVGAIILAVLMALSRIYLFVHFPTDILGSIVLSSLIFAGLRVFLIKRNASV